MLAMLGSKLLVWKIILLISNHEFYTVLLNVMFNLARTQL